MLAGRWHDAGMTWHSIGAQGVEKVNRKFGNVINLQSPRPVTTSS